MINETAVLSRPAYTVHDVRVFLRAACIIEEGLEKLNVDTRPYLRESLRQAERMLEGVEQDKKLASSTDWMVQREMEIKEFEDQHPLRDY